MKSHTQNFKAKFQLVKIDTRNNPLFSRIRVYLLIEQHKIYFRQSYSFKDNVAHFDALLEEPLLELYYNSISGQYEQFPLTIIAEFQADNRFMKMGETHLNIADIINLNKNNEVIAYPIHKCYDKQAKMHLAIQLLHLTQRQEIPTLNLSRTINDTLTRSHSQFTPYSRLKIKSAHMNVFPTEYSIHNEPKEQFDLYYESQSQQIQQKEIDYTIRHTQQNSKLYELTQEVRQLQKQLMQQQLNMNRQQQHLQQSLEDISRLQQELEQHKQCIFILQQQKEGLMVLNDELKKQIKKVDNQKESQKEHYSLQINKYCKMYQESQNERNKIRGTADQLSQQNLLLQQHLNQEQAKQRQFIIKQQEHIYANKGYMNQIEELQRMIQIFKKDKIVYEDKIDKFKLQQKKITQQIICDRQSKDQLQQQLQVSRFSLKELERQISQIRKQNIEQRDQLKRYENDIHMSNSEIKQEREHFKNKLRQYEQQTQREHYTVQMAMEELQIKTVNQNNQQNLINNLRKEITKYKKMLNFQKKKEEEMNEELQRLRAKLQQTEKQFAQEQSKFFINSKQKIIIQNELKRCLEELKNLKENQINVVVKEEDYENFDREYFKAECYEERDEYWKAEVEKIEIDTKLLIQKFKREKDSLLKNQAQMEEKIEMQKNQVKKGYSQNKNMKEQIQILNKSLKQLQNKTKLQNLDLQNLQKKLQDAVKQKRAMIQKLEELEAVERDKKKLQNKLSMKQNELNNLLNSYDLQKGQMNEILEEIKQVVYYMSSYLCKSSRQKIFYEDLNCKYLNFESIQLINNSIKKYVDQHNRIKKELEQKQVQKQIQIKDKQRINTSIKTQRKSITFEKDLINHNRYSRDRKESNTEQNTNHLINILKTQIEELKNKYAKQINEKKQISLELDNYVKNLEEKDKMLESLKDEFEKKGQELFDLNQRLKQKQRLIETFKQQVRDSEEQIEDLKADIQHNNKLMKQQRAQQVQMRKSSAHLNRSVVGIKSQLKDENYYQLVNSQKKCEQLGLEIDKLKKEKDEKKNDLINQTKTIKRLQNTLKEKDINLTELKKQLQEEKAKGQHIRQMHQLKLKKLKQEHAQELQEKEGVQKILNKSIEEMSQKIRQISKKLKVIEDTNKSLNSELSNTNQKHQKQLKLVENEFEIKLKTTVENHAQQINNLKNLNAQFAANEKKKKEKQKKMDKQLQDSKQNLSKLQMINEELSIQIQMLKNQLKEAQEIESKQASTIKILEKKLIAPIASNKEGFQSLSNCQSVKAYTFRV